MVQLRRLLRDLNGGKDRDVLTSGVSANVPKLERKLRWNDQTVGAEVIGLYGQRSVRMFNGDESLSSDHTHSGWVYGPSDPAVGFGRRSCECY